MTPTPRKRRVKMWGVFKGTRLLCAEETEIEAHHQCLSGMHVAAVEVTYNFAKPSRRKRRVASDDLVRTWKRNQK